MNDLKFTTAGDYMNQHVYKLKQQAGIEDNPDQKGLDLFAELVIRECAEVAGGIDKRVVLEYFGLKDHD